MSRLRVLPVLLSVVAVLTGCTVLTGCAQTSSGQAGFVGGDGSYQVLPTDRRPAAPLIEGTTLDGAAWSSAQTAGKVVVYNVWGSWCSPCRAEAPALVAASRAAGDAAVFVGLNTRDLDKSAPTAFVRAFEVPYANLYDPDGALILKFSGQLPASAIPSTILVDPQGRVAARIVGATTEALLTGLIQDLAAGR